MTRLQISLKMKPVLVCFALEEEAAPFRRLASAKAGVSILITGIGRKNAEESTRKYLGNAPAPGAASDAPVAGVCVRESAQSLPSTPGVRPEGVPNRSRGGCAPELVITCGFAGGLNPELRIGNVVFSTDEPALHEKLTAAGATPAKFFCATHVAVTAAEKAELRRTTGADAVEMESEAIQALWRERGIPCATVRVISDTAHEDMPLDFNRLAQPDFSLDYGKLALVIAKSPGKIPALLRLQKNTKLAARLLADVLAKVIWG